MNCNRMEELLPAYLEGDVSEMDRAAIERHLAACVECRGMLAQFRDLESSLATLKSSVPSWKSAEARFDRRWGRMRWYSFGRIFLTAPALGGLALAILGAALLSRGREITTALEPFSAMLASRSGELGSFFIRLVDAFAGVDIVLLSSFYGLLALAILLVNVRFAVRWVRR
jgi:predicted anti-sigma-YlaC factor YlaD